MSLEAGKALAAKLRGEFKKYRKIGDRIKLVEHLHDLGTPDARKLKKRMNETRHSTDKAPSAGAAWNPKGKPLVRGSKAKCERILSGIRAKNSHPR